MRLIWNRLRRTDLITAIEAFIMPKRAPKPVPTENLTVNQTAEYLNSCRDHVLKLIHSGQVRATNIAQPHARIPRYRIRLQDLHAYEESRVVVPDGGLSTTRRLRRQAETGVKEFF